MTLYISGNGTYSWAVSKACDSLYPYSQYFVSDWCGAEQMCHDVLDQYCGAHRHTNTCEKCVDANYTISRMIAHAGCNSTGISAWCGVELVCNRTLAKLCGGAKYKITHNTSTCYECIANYTDPRPAPYPTRPPTPYGFFRCVNNKCESVQGGHGGSWEECRDTCYLPPHFPTPPPPPLTPKPTPYHPPTPPTPAVLPGAGCSLADTSMYCEGSCTAEYSQLCGQYAKPHSPHKNSTKCYLCLTNSTQPAHSSSGNSNLQILRRIGCDYRYIGTTGAYEFCGLDPE